MFCLPSTFLELLVARSVSWQETLYMYKYISTYKGRFCLFLYLYTWYIQSLLTYVFFAAWVPYGFLGGLPWDVGFSVRRLDFLWFPMVSYRGLPWDVGFSVRRLGFLCFPMRGSWDVGFSVGFLWFPMVSCGFLSGVALGCWVFGWFPMGSYGFLWGVALGCLLITLFGVHAPVSFKHIRHSCFLSSFFLHMLVR